MITGIHHINFLVSDLSPAVKYLSGLTSQAPVFNKLIGRQADTASFQLGGIYLVLVCPQTPESLLGKLLASRGEGLFLLSLSVESLSSALIECERRGIQTNPSSQRKGLAGWTVCDLEPPHGLGPILQLCQPT